METVISRQPRSMVALIVCLVLSVLLVAGLAGVAIYQTQTIISLLKEGTSWIGPCKRPDSGSICSVYVDRFGAIAAGSVVPLIFSGAPMLYLHYAGRIRTARGMLTVLCATVFMIFIIHFSGLLIYLVRTA